jgi:hypothetical protein
LVKADADLLFGQRVRRHETTLLSPHLEAHGSWGEPESQSMEGAYDSARQRENPYQTAGR